MNLLLFIIMLWFFISFHYNLLQITTFPIKKHPNPKQHNLKHEPCHRESFISPTELGTTLDCSRYLKHDSHTQLDADSNALHAKANTVTCMLMWPELWVLISTNSFKLLPVWHGQISSPWRSPVGILVRCLKTLDWLLSNHGLRLGTET